MIPHGFNKSNAVGFLSSLNIKIPRSRYQDHILLEPRRIIRYVPSRLSLRGVPRAADPAASDASNVWARVRVAVPLSRVFADRLGNHVLHRLSEHKYKVVCPFHNDKNPSLHIDDSIGLFHCFGCAANGSIIDFEQLMAGHRSISTALRSLASKYPPIAKVLNYTSNSSDGPTNQCDDSSPGVVAHSESSRLVPRLSRRARITQISIALDVLREAASAYIEELWNPDNSFAVHYLCNVRNLSLPTLQAFSCGFAPSHLNSSFILSRMKSLGYEPHHVELAGIARAVNRILRDNNIVRDSGEDEDSLRFYDVFRDRVVFPIRDKNARIISFAARSLPNAPPSAPKYVNGADSPVFSKRRTLFGADLAVNAPSAKVEDGFVIVLEGYLDVMTLFDRTQGRAACVATMGTSASEAQLRAAYDLLKDPVDGKVIINFDGDDAGFKSVERLCDFVIPELYDCAHAFYVAFPPFSVKDADEFLNSIGTADEYVEGLLQIARPWYQWRGDRIVDAELDRMQSTISKDIESRSTKYRDIELSDLGMEDESDSSIILAEILRKQQDDMAVAFGASPESQKNLISDRDPPPCSEEVLGALAEIIACAHKCLPGLNVAALSQSWVDSLSRSTPTIMLSLYHKLIAQTERLTRPWRHLSVQTQVYWMPPAPWLLAELPRWKRNSLGYGSDGSLGAEQSDTENLLDYRNPLNSNSRDLEPKYLQRSKETIDFQNKYVIPFFEARQCERTKRLKLAPRRSAEEIVLRALIFASEENRLDGLSALVEIMIRCQEKGLPFWTSIEREKLFEYLASLEGPVSPDEMGAYLEEYEWFTAEIEELFMSVEDETDMEWKEIRMLELKSPVEIVKTTASSVEKMAVIVASRQALNKSGDILQEMVEKQALMESDLPVTSQEQLAKEINSLASKQMELQYDIDGKKFLTPDELAEQNQEMEEAAREAKMESERLQLLAELEETETLAPPEWMENNESSQSEL